MAAPGDLWVIACHFNPAGFRTRTALLKRFIEPLAAATPNWRVIECATSHQPFDLEAGPNVMQVRCDSVLWHGERLFNLVTASLPPSCTKVVWADADVLFANDRWLHETSARLDEFPVVQPYEHCIRLPKGHATYRGKGRRGTSFAAMYARDPAVHRMGDYSSHGHPGLAWGCRREIIDQVGLYEPHPMGGADELMAHAFVGDTSSKCVDLQLKPGTNRRLHFERWAARAFTLVQGRLGFVPGEIWHLWHGRSVNRRYADRTLTLDWFDFDPDAHLRMADSGCREWHNAPKGLIRDIERYFADRDEDEQLDPRPDGASARLRVLWRRVRGLLGRP